MKIYAVLLISLAFAIVLYNFIMSESDENLSQIVLNRSDVSTQHLDEPSFEDDLIDDNNYPEFIENDAELYLHFKALSEGRISEAEFKEFLTIREQKKTVQLQEYENWLVRFGKSDEQEKIYQD